MTNMCLTGITPTECEVRPLRGRRLEAVPADLVVLVTPNAAQSELYDELRSELPDIRRIGDAASPRDVQAAIADGRRAGMQWD
jgi:hypothetical protein